MCSSTMIELFSAKHYTLSEVSKQQPTPVHAETEGYTRSVATLKRCNGSINTQRKEYVVRAGGDVAVRL